MPSRRATAKLASFTAVSTTKPADTLMIFKHVRLTNFIYFAAGFGEHDGKRFDCTCVSLLFDSSFLRIPRMYLSAFFSPLWPYPASVKMKLGGGFWWA
jgi:hypothetical protein